MAHEHTHMRWFLSSIQIPRSIPAGLLLIPSNWPFLWFSWETTYESHSTWQTSFSSIFSQLKIDTKDVLSFRTLSFGSQRPDDVQSFLKVLWQGFTKQTFPLLCYITLTNKNAEPFNYQACLTHPESQIFWQHLAEGEKNALNSQSYLSRQCQQGN